jgi:hypothetical protein
MIPRLTRGALGLPCFLVRSFRPGERPLERLAETDPRFHTLARGKRVEVASSALLLWAPDYVPAERIRHRGSVAIALDAAASDCAPELWLDGKPYVFLRPGDADPTAWLGEHRSGRAVWFTYDGATLNALRGVDVDGGGRLVVDLERIAG